MEYEDMNKDPQQDHGEVSIARKAGRLGRLMHRYYAIDARNHGAVGDPLRGQGRVLAMLAAKPETTQRELSFLLDMRQQSLSELLAKLEEKGYITREKSQEDGRVTVVKLTEEGSSAAPSADQMNHHADALDCLNDEERAQFEQLVDKITASLEEKLVALGDDPYAPPRPQHDDRRRPGDSRGKGGDFDGPRGRGRDGERGGFDGGRGRGRDGERGGFDGPRDRGRGGFDGGRGRDGGRGFDGGRGRGRDGERGFGGRGRDGERGGFDGSRGHGRPFDGPRGNGHGEYDGGRGKRPQRHGWNSDDDHLRQA